MKMSSSQSVLTKKNCVKNMLFVAVFFGIWSCNLATADFDIGNALKERIFIRNRRQGPIEGQRRSRPALFPTININVPTIRQCRSHDCVPASVESVLRSLGAFARETAFSVQYRLGEQMDTYHHQTWAAQYAAHPRAEGTILENALTILNTHIINQHLNNGRTYTQRVINFGESIDGYVRRSLDSGAAPIVGRVLMGRERMTYPHVVVITGITGEPGHSQFRIMDPAYGTLQWMTTEQFNARVASMELLYHEPEMPTVTEANKESMEICCVHDELKH